MPAYSTFYRTNLCACINQSRPDDLKALLELQCYRDILDQKSSSGFAPLELAIRISLMPPNGLSQMKSAQAGVCVGVLAAASSKATIDSAWAYARSLTNKKYEMNESYGRKRHRVNVKLTQRVSAQSVEHLCAYIEYRSNYYEPRKMSLMRSIFTLGGRLLPA